MNLNHLHLHVQDLDRAKRFYESYLSFEERRREDEILFLRSADGFDLALTPDPRPASMPEWFHFGFRLPTAQEVRNLHQRMRAEGVRMPKPLFEAEDLVSFRCTDPDGYAIEIYWE